MKKLLGLLALTPLAITSCNMDAVSINIEKPDDANKGQLFLYDVYRAEYTLNYTDKEKVTEHINATYAPTVEVNGTQFSREDFIVNFESNYSFLDFAGDAGLTYELSVNWKDEVVSGAETIVKSDHVLKLGFDKEKYISYIKDEFYKENGPSAKDPRTEAEFEDLYEGAVELIGDETKSEQTITLIANGTSYLISGMATVTK